MIKKGKYIAVRPSRLIEARYDLTASQNDILDIVLSKIDNDNNYLYELNINDYKTLYNTDTSNIYRDLKKAVKEFEGKGFYLIDNENKKEIFFSWFASILYLNEEGKIVVEVGQRLKKLLVEMKKRIYYKIEYPINFRSIYSKRIYYYLKSFEDTGWRIDNLDELRKKLQCPKSYNKYSFFRIKVLEIAKKEINNYSDLQFDYEEIKTKRKVTSIRFFIKPNKKSNIEDNEIALDKYNIKEKVEELETLNLIKQVQKIFTKHKITEHEAKCMLKDANNNLELINKCYRYALSKNINENFVGYIRTIIKDFHEPQKNIKTKTDNFNDYEQRNYDFDALEKKLLGWDSSAEQNFEKENFNVADFIREKG